MHLGPFPRAELQELKRKLSDLATVMPGVSGHAGVVKCLVNQAHKERCGKGQRPGQRKPQHAGGPESPESPESPEADPSVLAFRVPGVDSEPQADAPTAEPPPS